MVKNNKLKSEGFARYKKVIVITSVCVGGLIVLLSLILLLYQLVLKNRVYYGVKLNGTSVANMDSTELVALLEQENRSLAQKEVFLKASDKEVSATLSDIGLSIDTSRTVNKCLETAKNENIFVETFEAAKVLVQNKDYTYTLKLHRDTYNAFLQNTDKALYKEPVNASISVVKGEVVVAEGINGYEISVEKLPKLIAEAVTKNSQEIILEPETVEPYITSANLLEAKNDALRIINLDLVLDYNQTNYKPSKTIKGEWVKFVTTENVTTASLDEEKVGEYIDMVGGKIYVATVDQKINNETNEVIQTGVQGKSINKEKTLASIVNAINKGIAKVPLVVETTDFKERKICSKTGLELGRYPSKYLDADLSTQRMCLVNGYTLEQCITISSGKPSTPTPSGDYAIYQKLRQNISPLVILNWWQRFKANGYGLHEIPMLPNGVSVEASKLGTKASHGCIRMGVGNAEMVYNWTELGTPIYIHN